MITGVVLTVLCWASIVLISVAAIRLNEGLRPRPFLIGVMAMLCFNIVGAWLFALEASGRPFPDLERAYGVELLVHTISLTALFVCGAWTCSRVRLPVIRFRGQDTRAFRLGMDWGMWMLGVFGLFIFLLYLSKLDRVPLFGVLSGHAGGTTGTKLLRTLATAKFAGQYFRYAAAMFTLLPVVSWYFLCRCISKGGFSGGLPSVAFLLLFLLNLFVSVVSLQKGPILIYVAFTYLVYLLASEKPPQAWAFVIGLMILLTVLPFMIMYFSGHSSTSYLDALVAGLSRIVTGQIFPGVLYLEFFPKHEGFLMGRSLPNPGGIFEFTPVVAEYVTWCYFFPELKALGIRGTPNTAFYFQGYVNWGYLGMYVIAPLTGLLVMMLSNCISCVGLRELRLPMTSLLARECMRLSMTSFTQIFVAPWEVLSLLVTLSVPLLASGVQCLGRAAPPRTRPE